MKGRVEVFTVQDGLWRPVRAFSNTIVYTGYDAMARAVAGDADYAVTGMYVIYKNGVPSQDVVPATRTAAYYPLLADPYGYVRVRTLSLPVFTTSDPAKYSSNIATFTAVTDGTRAGGAPIIDGTSQFFSLALVAMPDYGHQSGDTLVAAASIMDGATFAPLTKLANSQLGFRWALQLGS